jgi:hypothetical protein
MFSTGTGNPYGWTYIGLRDTDGEVGCVFLNTLNHFRMLPRSLPTRASSKVMALVALTSGLGFGLSDRFAQPTEPGLTQFCATIAPPPITRAGPEMPAADFVVTIFPSPLNWNVNGAANPTLILTRGQTYLFDLSGVGAQHPFVINSNNANAGGTLYAGPASATTISFTPDLVMPATIYYHCQVHFTTMVGTIQLVSPPLQVSLRAYLEGPYNTPSLDMNDDLRAAGLVPLAQPYTALGYSFVGGGAETVTPAVLAVTGPNAVIDWVIVELRNPANPSLVVQSRAGLIQADGDVVAANGTSPMQFTLANGPYHVALRHRTHLGVMSLGPISLSGSIVAVDFTLPATATFGTEARKTIGAVSALWMGDTNFNGSLSYTGAGNDRDPILINVGSTTPNNTVNGYFAADLNLNGTTGYTGLGNDRDPILINVGSTTPNNVRLQQLP